MPVLIPVLFSIHLLAVATEQAVKNSQGPGSLPEP